MATVNGLPVYMSELNDLLIRSYGLAQSRQLIATELIRQAAAAKGITVSKNDIDAETNETMKEMFPTVTEASQQEQLLQQMLAGRNMSQEQWNIVMERNATLRKLAEPNVTVSDDELRDEFAQEYGGKVQVRHIQVESLATAQDVIKKLKAGADFAELAAKVSANPSGRDGGLLPPFGANTKNVPPAIRQAALALKKVGQISDPVEVETAFHILKLESIIQPQDAKFIDVKDKLTAKVRQRKIRLTAQQTLQDIIRQAQESNAIQYVDPILREQFIQAQEKATRQE